MQWKSIVALQIPLVSKAKILLFLMQKKSFTGFSIKNTLEKKRAEAEEEALREVQKAGVEIIRPDKSLFAEKVKDIYEGYKDDQDIYPLIKQIQEKAPFLDSITIAHFKELATTGKIENVNPMLISIFRKENQSFLSSWIEYSPEKEIQKARKIVEAFEEAEKIKREVGLNSEHSNEDAFKSIGVTGENIRIGVAAWIDTTLVIMDGIKETYPKAEIVRADRARHRSECRAIMGLVSFTALCSATIRMSLRVVSPNDVTSLDATVSGERVRDH